MIYLDYPASAGDPFWDDVLLLLPMDGSGQTFEDKGPYSADSVISVIGSDALAFQQNTTQTLFGNPTLEMTFVAGISNSVNLFVENLAVSVPNGRDMCMEWWFYQTSWANAATPIHARAVFRLPGDPVIGGASYPVPPQSMYFRTTNNNPGQEFYSGTYAAATWRYVAMQYVNADAKIYVFIDGTNIGSYGAPSMVYSPGLRFFVGDSISTTPAGLAADNYSARVAQIRLTAANRYGSNSTITVPTGPWPTN